MNRKVFYLLCVALLLFCGCEAYRNQQKLQTADAVINTHPDSAYHLVSSIPTNALSSDKDKALYGLLLCQSQYKMYKKTSSAPLSYSIDYFAAQKDYPHLQRCYYYRAAINYDKEGDKKAIFKDLKAAEELIPQVNDSALTMRLYDLLSHVNGDIINKVSALYYGKKAVEIADKIGDKEALALSLNNLMATYMMTDYPDSSYFYLRKALNVCPHVSQNTRNTIYQSAAILYLSDNDTKKANTFVQQISNLNSDERLDLVVGELYSKMGKPRKSIPLLLRATQSKAPSVASTSYSTLSDVYAKTGQYKEAYHCQDKGDSIYETYLLDKHDKDYMALQAKYNVAIQKAHDDKVLKNTYLCLLAVISLVLLVLVMVSWKVIRKEKRIRRLLNEIEEMNQHIDSLTHEKNQNFEEKLAELKQLVDQKEMLIDNLRHSLRQSERTSMDVQALSDGVKWIYYLMAGEEDLNMGKTDLQKVAKCFRILDNDFIENVEACGVTPREEVFCILFRMNKSPKEIQAILGMTDNAYRQLKFRTLKKLSTKESMKKFCYNLG